jgi:hypothetical protein
MATITFFPIGNADTAIIRLSSSKLVLVDYANMRDINDKDDKRCDLPFELRQQLRDAGQNDFRVVCFSHLDMDHVKGMGDFFWLEHSTKYQIDGRPKIEELWVPAAAITEVGVEDDSRLVRQEARYRLIKGEKIKVFSRPGALKNFLQDNGLSIDARRDCIVDAGEVVPDFTLDGPEHVEFFVHSPFAWRVDDEALEDRNQNSIVFQVTFREFGQDTYGIFGGDVDSDTLVEIVKTTRNHERDHRLLWDVLKLFHHCSYKALNQQSSEPDEPIDPVEEVRWLIEDQGRSGAIIVSPSAKIPTQDTKGANPPHRRAAVYYKSVIEKKDGEFKVTMDHPTSTNPRPLRIEVDQRGASVAVIIGSSIGTATQSPTRAGYASSDS